MLGWLKHNPDTKAALKAWGYGVLVRAGRAILATGYLITMTLGQSTLDIWKGISASFQILISFYWVENARQCEYVTITFDHNYMTWPKGAGAKTDQHYQGLSGASSLKFTLFSYVKFLPFMTSFCNRSFQELSSRWSKVDHIEIALVNKIM